MKKGILMLFAVVAMAACSTKTATNETAADSTVVACDTVPALSCDSAATVVDSAAACTETATTPAK